MRYNVLGQTGLSVSQLGFGCGSTGGILLRAEYPAMRQVVARAIELGVNYFDTASYYGSGQSEVNLGAVLRDLGANVIVGSKARPPGSEMADMRGAIIRSVEASLRRLGRTHIDLIQFHNRMARQSQPERDVAAFSDLDAVLSAFATLQQQGKIRYWGLAGQAASDVLHEAVAGGGFQSIQLPYNLINPSAGEVVPQSFPFQNYAQLIDHAAQQHMGVIAFRILAGGALSGVTERHPVANPVVDAIASELDYASDVARARRYSFLVEDGSAGSLVEAAIRFAVSKPGISTAILGISSQEQLEQAVEFVERGPLPAAVLQRIRATWSQTD